MARRSHVRTRQRKKPVVLPDDGRPPSASVRPPPGRLFWAVAVLAYVGLLLVAGWVGHSYLGGFATGNVDLVLVFVALGIYGVIYGCLEWARLSQKWSDARSRRSVRRSWAIAAVAALPLTVLAGTAAQQVGVSGRLDMTRRYALIAVALLQVLVVGILLRRSGVWLGAAITTAVALLLALLAGIVLPHFGVSVGTVIAVVGSLLTVTLFLMLWTEYRARKPSL
jgi:hypothetical protein